MVSKKLLSFLDKHSVTYEIVEHRKVFTAYDTAATLHVPLETIIKTVCIGAKNGIFFVLVPANKKIDLKKVAKLLKVPRVSFLSEKEMAQKLKVKFLSAPPLPLGEYYSYSTLCEKSLLSLKKAYFGSGDFCHSLCIVPKSLFKISTVVSGSFCLSGTQKMIIPKPPKKNKKKNTLKKIIKKKK